jgi:hypothetical protein
MVCLQIEAEQRAERAIARRLERYGCRVIEEGPTTIWVEFPEARNERDAIIETRLYLGSWIQSVLSLGAARAA